MLLDHSAVRRVAPQQDDCGSVGEHGRPGRILRPPGKKRILPDRRPGKEDGIECVLIEQSSPLRFVSERSLIQLLQEIGRVGLRTAIHVQPVLGE